ncbi:MAG: Fic family protein [Elusimicrobiota bacterium]|jgi:Fic family protein|nr:Fic family protein [Elusimicrobiota bacterium]
MFNPKYTLTKELLDNISAIERLYGQIEQIQLPQSLWLNLERDNLMQSAYVSNSIEGNPLSLAEVTNLLLDSRVPANRNEKEIANYFGILKKLPLLKNFTLQTLLDIHKELLAGVNDEIAGIIRDDIVVVGNKVMTTAGVKLIVKHNPPYHKREDIINHLSGLVDWVEQDKQTLPILKAAIFHHHYVYLHPFVDGNGRTCRLLTAFLLILNGYMINKYFVLDDYYDIDRKLYSDKLSSADTGDLTQWLQYFTTGIKYSLQSAIAKAKNSLSLIEISLRPTTRQSQILEHFSQIGEFTAEEVMQLLNISRQQANNLIRGLIEKGRISKQGKTKGVYYKIV